MTRNEKQRVLRAIQKLSAVTGVPATTVSQYVELDLTRIATESHSLPTARLRELEKICTELAKTGVDLQRTLATKEANLAEISGRVDRARITLLERNELLIERQGELSVLQARRAAVDENIRVAELAVRKSKFEIIRLRPGTPGKLSAVVVRVALALFTAVGVIVAVLLILGRR